MQLSKKIASRLRSAARYIEKPDLFALRRKGVALDIYETLNQTWLKNAGIATVLDIGANTGQFAMAVQAAMPTARIYSFEPVPECFLELQKKMAGAKNFSAFNIGLGESAANLNFERNVFSPSSSFLKMTDVHKNAFPWTRESQSITVPVLALDEVSKRLEMLEPMLIKIDVQGYENRVLRGGEITVRRAAILITETSFETLYHGQALFDEIYFLLRGWGFRYVGMLDQIYHPTDGRVLQADSIFVRQEWGWGLAGQRTGDSAGLSGEISRPSAR